MQPPYHPHEYTIDSNVQSDRHAFGTVNGTVHQHQSGHYEVVPPIPANPNTGSTGHNPYEFIVASNNNPKTGKLGLKLGAGQSFLLRVSIVLGGVVILVIVAAVLVAILTPKGSTPGLTLAAERQQEIIRVSTLATRQVSGQDTSNFVNNVNISITSSQQQVINYLSKHGVKIPPKTLALDEDSQTDTLLTNAASAGTYDSVAAQELASQLKTYENLLRDTYKQTSSAQAKQLMKDSFTSADNLLKQYGELSNPGS